MNFILVYTGSTGGIFGNNVSWTEESVFYVKALTHSCEVLVKQIETLKRVFLAFIHLLTFFDALKISFNTCSKL